MVVAVLAALAPVAGAAPPERRPAGLALVDARACSSPTVWTARAPLAIAAGVDGAGGCAALRLRLERAAELEFLVLQRKPRPRVVHRERRWARAGLTTVVWRPAPGSEPRTYVTQLRIRGTSEGPWLPGPVIRIRGTTARFAQESAQPGATVSLVVDDAPGGATLDVVDPATEQVVSGPRPLRRRTLRLRVGSWEPGIYAARIRTRSGTLVHAPLVVGAPPSSRPRVAVVLPTSTWQAYNLRDGDGDGWGDSWYATDRRESARLDRPYLGDGLPPFFGRYDLPFLRWFRKTGRSADFLTDEDLDRVTSADALARRYDLVVLPGHHEYVTEHELDLLEGFRDRGGNLAFLSADNLHWRVERHGSVLRRKEQFRRTRPPRPEAALVGVQYRASDDGTHKGHYVVRRTDCAPWLFAGTRLAVGSRFGWNGVEIDATTADSPRGTCVVAEIPHLLGRGRSAQMTYYATPRGAKVFAAGAFAFPSRTWVVRTLLDNLWERLSRP